MKSDKRVLEKTRAVYNNKTQFKLVISDQTDYAYAKAIIKEIDPANSIIQPEWSHRKLAPQIIEQVKKDGLQCRVILQQHKVILGCKKGV